MNGDLVANCKWQNHVFECVRLHSSRIPKRVFITSIEQEISITWDQLHRICNQFAHFLAHKEIQANDRILLLTENTIENLIAYFAVQRYGASVCTINLTVTASHELPKLLSLLCPRMILAQGGLDSASLTGCTDGEWIRLGTYGRASTSPDCDDLFARIAHYPETPELLPVNKPADCAAIFFSSGTDDQPKAMAHAFEGTLLNAELAAECWCLTAADRMLEYRSFGWISPHTLCLQPALLRGAEVVFANAFDRSQFFEWVRKHQPTVCIGVPTVITSLLDEHAPLKSDLASLRIVTSSSAPLPVHVQEEFEHRYGLPVVQAYGTAEAGVIAGNRCTNRRIGTVGVPGRHHDLRIVDDQGSALPPGEIGEVELGGPAIALGYIDGSGSFRSLRGNRLRTGDRGRLDQDGFLTLTGRSKEIIIRGGENISPIEVENALLAHFAVREAACFAIPHRTLGEEVGAAVTLRANAKVSERELKAFLGSRLRRTRLPRKIVVVERLPKGRTGKLRRIGMARRLGLDRDPTDHRRVTTAKKPSTITTRLASIWVATLGLNKIGLDDDFFYLGGDSLQAVALLMEVADRFGVTVTSDEIFGEASTIRGMAQLIESRVRNPYPESEIPTVSRKEPIPASHTQQAFWTHARLFPEDPGLNMAAAFRLRGPMDGELLQNVANKIMARHETLRTALRLSGGQLYQVILPPAPVQLDTHMLSGLTQEDREREATAFMRERIRQPFDLEEGQVSRFYLIRLGPKDHILLLVIHHAMADGWSTEVLFNDLASFYDALESGSPPRLPELKLQYADYSSWQRLLWERGDFANDARYWRHILRDSPRKTKPATRPERTAPHWRGCRRRLRLPATVAEMSAKLARDHHTTLFITLLTGFCALLSRLANTTDVLVGILAANRGHREMEALVGCFMNPLPLRLDLAQDPTFEELLERACSAAAAAYAHQRGPLYKIMSDLHGSGKERFEAPFPVLLQSRTYRGAEELSAGAIQIERYDFDPGTAAADLSISFTKNSAGLICDVDCRTDRFDDNVVDYMTRCYLDLLAACVSSPEKHMSVLTSIVCASSSTDRALGEL